METDKVPVFLRIRPCAPDRENVLKIINSRAIELTAVKSTDQSIRRGLFTAVLGPDTTQQQVFRDCGLPLVESLLQKNLNGLLLTYGASGSGKTHTVSGYGENSTGILGQTVKFLFDNLDCEPHLAKLQPSRFDETTDIEDHQPGPSKGVWISVVQVLNEVVTDLLCDASTQPLSVSQDSSGRCFVRNAKWLHAQSEKAAMLILQDARKRQSIASTKLNVASSRSHFLVFIKVIRRGPTHAEFRVGQIAVVDLAGTERQEATGSSGQVLRQAGFINSSLLVLRRCIEALRKGNRQIPFRDSKLTRLLSPFFSTTVAKVALIVCVSSEKERLSDTIGTIKFSALASGLTQPQEALEQVQETRRKSAQFECAQLTDAETIQIPVGLYREMQAASCLAEKLIVQKEELCRKLNVAEEAAENARLMYQDKMTSLRKEHRSAMKALRDEEKELRAMVKEDLLDDIQKLMDKNSKYKKQAKMMAVVLRDRLYPELEKFRSTYGLLEEFPELTVEELQSFEPKENINDACPNCQQLEKQLNEAIQKHLVKIQQCERMSEELRSERELRVLLQENVRANSLCRTRFPNTTMELTCEQEFDMVLDVFSTTPSSSQSDSGNETANDPTVAVEPVEVVQLRNEISRLREDLLDQMRMTDQKELVVAEYESTIRELEQKVAQLEIQLVNCQTVKSEAISCQLNCDRCRKQVRLQEIPKTAPPPRDLRLSPSAIRESKLTFTPVYRRLPTSVRKKLTRTDIPRRRLARPDSSDDD